MSSDAPAGRGGRGVGRRKGEGRGGRGRGSNLGEGNNAGGAPKFKPNPRSRRRGGKPNKPTPMSDEEKRRIEEENKAAEEAAHQEEERKRQEEERKAAEAAKQVLIQQQIDLCKQVNDACELLAMTVETAQQHKESRAAFAAEPLSKARKDFEASKKSLKSDLKKCTAFVKKIKSGSAWSMRPAEIQRDVATLNLSRYVEEVASALTDAKLKAADLPVVVALCSAMHQRYPDFLPAALPFMWSTIHGKATEETAKLRRLYLRIITEFLLNGLITETKPLIKTVGEATGGTDGSYVVTDANLVMSFVKSAGFEILGTTPRAIQDSIELLKRESERALETASQKDDTDDSKEAESEILTTIDVKLAEKALTLVNQVEGVLGERAVSPAVTEVFATYCVGAYQFLATSLKATHAKLHKLEKRCEQDRLVSGSLTEVREKGLADARKLLDSLQKSVETLSDVLVQPLPELEEEQEEGDGDGTGIGLELWTKEGEGEDFGPFDDEETRAFYCDIPDLLTTIPPVLLGMTQDDIDRIQAENLVKYGAGYESVLEEGDSSEEMVASSEADFEATEAEGQSEQVKEGVETEGEDNKDTPHYKLMVLLEQELPECSRREQVDEIAEKFCVNHGSSKTSRKRLTKTLFLVPRARLDLLPFYSRLTAILDRVFPDMSASLLTDLEQQFHGQAKFKKNQNVESRLKTARYIGELTKFRVAPPIIALRCIRRCLDDFNGFNVDVSCCMLESCGRYLYRMKHTNARLTALMDAMIRISKARNLDERAQALINSAFYMVKPPPAGPRKQAKVYQPLEAYLRNLLLVRLTPTDSMVSFVSKALLRFPWNDPSQQCGALICRYMMKACRKGRYKVIYAVAAVASSMRRSRPEVAARLIDAVLEDLQWSMEYPSFRDQQRTITYAKLLGELHSFSLVSGPTVIQQLYNFINLGHEIPEALREASEKQLANNSAGESGKGEVLPVYNSAGVISQTIKEDEEMDEVELDTKEEGSSPEMQVVSVSRHSKYDPRVPCTIDLPNSVFRVKLVCTLLDTSAKHLVSRSNIAAVEGFLAAFQRYLFTKTLLPTEVEFALLDTFDAIDSRWRLAVKDTNKTSKGEHDKSLFGFPRYATWLEAHNATVAVEEADAVHEARTRARLEWLAGATDGIDSSIEGDASNDLGSMMDEDEYVDDHMSLSANDETDSEIDSHEGEEVASESDHESQQEAFSDEESLEESKSRDTDDDADEYVSDEEEIDEEAYMRQLEEEAFERELRRLTIDALEKGKTTARMAAGGKVSDNMPSGSQFIRKKPAETSKSDDDEPVLALGGQEGISFQLLKKGHKGKMQVKKFVVPLDTNLAKRATKQDDEAAKERDLLKARVLQYEADSAEQGLSGGNVYLEQEKLQFIRNRPLTMDDIDRNFGSTGGDSVASKAAAVTKPTPGSRRSAPPSMKPRSQPSGRGGRGGRGSSGRSLYF